MERCKGLGALSLISTSVTYLRAMGERHSVEAGCLGTISKDGASPYYRVFMSKCCHCPKKKNGISPIEIGNKVPTVNLIQVPISYDQIF